MRDAGQEPEPGARVEGLAQLDRDDAGERDAPGGWTYDGALRAVRGRVAMAAC